MTNQVNQAFEEWYQSKIDEANANNDMDMRHELHRSKIRYEYGYQAATRARESEINSLKERVAELEADLELLKPHPKCDMGCMLVCNMEGNAITELQADNNRLREALREITYSHDGYARKKAEQALATYDKLSEVKHATK